MSAISRARKSLSPPMRRKPLFPGAKGPHALPSSVVSVTVSDNRGAAHVGRPIQAADSLFSGSSRLKAGSRQDWPPRTAAEPQPNLKRYSMARAPGDPEAHSAKSSRPAKKPRRCSKTQTASLAARSTPATCAPFDSRQRTSSRPIPLPAPVTSLRRMQSPSTYSEIIPIVPSHVSTN